SDESTIFECHLMQVYGQSPMNELVTRWVHCSNPKLYVLLPVIGLHEILALMVQEGSINWDRFENFLEFQFLPEMNAYPAEKSILVMDNAPIHHGGQIQDLCDAHGMSINFLLVDLFEYTEAHYLI
ncbi:hypothetical protein CROQUDRAFT_43300, partial [Cronartium quercuum f. sp. fusiforme G11]